MDPSAAIAWYGKNQFNAADMERATGLSERSQRELAKLGILQTIPQSRTAPRLFDGRMLKRAALVHPFYEHGGFNLQVSGKIVYADPTLEHIVFDAIDPWEIYHRTLKGITEPEEEWRWFSSSESLKAERGDYYIATVNRHYIASGPGRSRHVFGHLTADRGDIVVYRGAVWDELLDPPEDISSRRDEFHPELTLVGASRAFQSMDPGRSELAAIRRALSGPISKFEINASLTLRLAMRRLLNINGADCEQH